MPLDPSFWEEEPVYCGRCFELHEVELPHQCGCGHVMKKENKHGVTSLTVMAGRAVFDAQTQEDARVIAMLNKIATEGYHAAP